MTLERPKTVLISFRVAIDKQRKYHFIELKQILDVQTCHYAIYYMLLHS